jgi:cell division inhibitor SulA
LPPVESIVNFSYAIPGWLESQSLEFWLILLLPLGLLPLMNSRWLLWLLPGIVLSYLSKIHPDWQNSSYTHFAVLAIVSSIASLGRLKRSVEGPSYQYTSVFVGWLAALLPCVVMLGALWFPAQ